MSPAELEREADILIARAQGGRIVTDEQRRRHKRAAIDRETFTEADGRAMFAGIPGTSSCKPSFDDEGRPTLTTEDEQLESWGAVHGRPLRIGLNTGGAASLMQFALWATSARDPQRRAQLVGGLSVALGCSSIIEQAAACRCSRRTIERAAEAARKEFGL